MRSLIIGVAMLAATFGPCKADDPDQTQIGILVDGVLCASAGSAEKFAQQAIEAHKKKSGDPIASADCTTVFGARSRHDVQKKKKFVVDGKLWYVVAITFRTAIFQGVPYGFELPLAEPHTFYGIQVTDTVAGNP